MLKSVAAGIVLITLIATLVIVAALIIDWARMRKNENETRRAGRDKGREGAYPQDRKPGDPLYPL